LAWSRPLSPAVVVCFPVATPDSAFGNAKL
jgi:hypothetical protein